MERRKRAIDSAIQREQMKLGAVQSVANILMNNMRRIRGERPEIDIDAVVLRCIRKWRKKVCWRKASLGWRTRRRPTTLDSFPFCPHLSLIQPHRPLASKHLSTLASPLPFAVAWRERDPFYSRDRFNPHNRSSFIVYKRGYFIPHDSKIIQRAHVFFT